MQAFLISLFKDLNLYSRARENEHRASKEQKQKVVHEVVKHCCKGEERGYLAVIWYFCLKKAGAL